MMTDYEVRVTRPWPGVRRDQVILVNGRRKDQLINRGMAVLVEKAKAKPQAAPKKKLSLKKKTVVKK